MYDKYRVAGAQGKAARESSRAEVRVIQLSIMGLAGRDCFWVLSLISGKGDGKGDQSGRVREIRGYQQIVARARR